MLVASSSALHPHPHEHYRFMTPVASVHRSPLLATPPSFTSTLPTPVPKARLEREARIRARRQAYVHQPRSSDPGPSTLQLAPLKQDEAVEEEDVSSAEREEPCPRPSTPWADARRTPLPSLSREDMKALASSLHKLRLDIKSHDISHPHHPLTSFATTSPISRPASPVSSRAH